MHVFYVLHIIKNISYFNCNPFINGIPQIIGKKDQNWKFLEVIFIDYDSRESSYMALPIYFHHFQLSTTNPFNTNNFLLYDKLFTMVYQGSTWCSKFKKKEDHPHLNTIVARRINIFSIPNSQTHAFLIDLHISLHLIICSFLLLSQSPHQSLLKAYQFPRETSYAIVRLRKHPCHQISETISYHLGTSMICKS